jgi:hypothetical protein
MGEERAEHQQYSEREVSEKLDELIAAWHEAETAWGALREFHSKYEHPPPSLTQVFEDGLSLDEYHNAQARYSCNLQEVTEQCRHTERVEEGASKVCSILPRGTSVFHNYVRQGEEPPERGEIPTCACNKPHIR